MLIRRIVSGGQTGVDRAALDAAIISGIEYGGWAPNGFWAEDGIIPERYRLVETPSSKTDQRTEWNVRDSDATLIIASPPLKGGTQLTKRLVNEHNKPLLVLDPDEQSIDLLVNRILEWLFGMKQIVLNIAGPRASEDARIYDKAFAIVKALIVSQDRNGP